MLAAEHALISLGVSFSLVNTDNSVNVARVNENAIIDQSLINRGC